jgi:putative transposase
MPVRKIPLITDQIYHVYNRGIDKRLITADKWDYRRLVKTLWFYRWQNSKIKLSTFLSAKSDNKIALLEVLNSLHFRVEILAYCIMPNHFHLLIRQLEDNGISKFIGDVENSYTRYFNLTQNRLGALLLNQFKAVRIEDIEQLLHLSRYIHLNPLTSWILIKPEELDTYEWSSWNEYMGQEVRITLCNTNPVLQEFRSRNEYRKFVLDQVDYQRELDAIKHLTLD